MSPFRFLSNFSTICLLILFSAALVEAQDFQISKSDVTLSIGKSESIVISSDNPIESGTVGLAGDGDFLEVEKAQTGDSVTLTLTPKKPTEGRILIVTVGGLSKPVTFTILSSLNFRELVFSSSQKGNELVVPSLTGIKTTKPIIQDDPYVVRIRKNDNTPIPDGLLTPKVEPEAAAKAVFLDGELTIIGKEPKNNVIVRLESEGIVGAIITVDVEEAASEINAEPITLTQGSEKVLSTSDIRIMGKEGRLLSLSNAKCTIDNAEIAAVTENCSKITAKTLTDRAYLTITSGSKVKTVPITVIQKSSRVVLSGPKDSKLDISYPNKTLTLAAQVLDANDKPMDVQSQELDWTILTGAGSEGSNDIGFNVDRKSNTAVVFANNAVNKNKSVRIQVCLKGATSAANPEGCDTLTTSVRVPIEISGFRPLKIRLDMLDRRTAIDLFGRKAVDEYFIAKIRLFNTIRKGDENFGNSILVYSESLEVKVGVEWRQRRDKDSSKKAVEQTNTTWTTLDEVKVKEWFPYGVTNHPDPKDPVFKNCHVIKQENMFIPYRPLTYEMVTNTQERRDGRSLRSQVLLTMNGLASLTSFVTSIAVPGSGSDLPIGLDKFKNLLIPSFEKLFPSRNEVQRQNITSMVMRPLEEIPFGSDITRILFFPRKPINGVLTNAPGARNTQLRISAISISDACAEAGVIQKLSTPTL